MRRLLALSAAAFLFGLPPADAAGPRLHDQRFVLERVARIPCGVRACLTGLAFAGSEAGRLLFVNVRTGSIRLIVDGRLDPRPFATVATTTEGEGGLLGLAADPAFDRGRPFLYYFFTLRDGSADRVERIGVPIGRIVPEGGGGHRDVLMRSLPSASLYHHGGILAFGPDGKLYVSNGEAHRAQRAQDPRALGGKIYRIDPDGAVPPDNPFEGSPTWSFGHRNPFGLAFDPVTDNLWESENGPQDHDEVNLIVPAKNYGWPVVRGDAGDQRFVDPVRDYVQTVVPTMMAFAGDAFPAAYRGDLFLGTYGEGTIRRFTLDATRTRIARESVFLSGAGVVGMAWGPDGLYFTTDTEVWRVRAKGAPPSTPPATPTQTPSAPPSPRPSGSKAPLAAGAAAAALALAALVWLARRRR